LRRTHLSPITVCAHCVDQSKCGHRCTDALLKELEQLRIEVERQREERVRAESYTHALLDQLAVLGASSSSHRHRHPHQHIRSQHRQPFQDEPVRPTTPTSSSAFASAGEEVFSASPICHRSLVFLGRCYLLSLYRWCSLYFPTNLFVFSVIDQLINLTHSLALARSLCPSMDLSTNLSNLQSIHFPPSLSVCIFPCLLHSPRQCGVPFFPQCSTTHPV
jgi:hypothetical protein